MGDQTGLELYAEVYMWANTWKTYQEDHDLLEAAATSIFAILFARNVINQFETQTIPICEHVLEEFDWTPLNRALVADVDMEVVGDDVVVNGQPVTETIEAA